MLDSLGWGEAGVLLVVVLFVFGPDRLPSLAVDAGRALRRVRLWFLAVIADLKQDLGPELGDLGMELSSLRPRALAAELLEEDSASTPVR